MKVIIGPYTNYNKKTKKTPPRKISVKIDKYDTWSMDHTLSHIIVPMLIQLKKTKQGIPNDMLTEEYNKLCTSMDYHLEKENGPLHKKEKALFKEAIKKWNDILDKMIWSFKEIRSDHKGENKFWKKDSFDNEGHKEYYKRVNEGTELFGKYYMNLWD